MAEGCDASSVENMVRDHPNSGAWKDFAAGTVAGVAITLVGHPFDTIKVRLQTQSTNAKFKGGLDCAVQTVKKEGLLGLYKGMGGPVCTVPLVNAIVFASYEGAKRFLVGGSDRDATRSELVMAGAFSGVVNSVVVSPVELIKSRLQIQYEAKKAMSRYHGPVHCATEIIKTGGLRAIMQGMVPTVIREVPAYATQFYVYERCKEILTPAGQSTKDLGPMSLMCCGGTAGLLCWFTSYPQDVIKSRIQVDVTGQKYPRHSFLPDGGIVSCSKQIWKAEGWRGFWKGFSPCALRAFPANAAGFLAYETTAELLR